ncbi:hypothetical protein RFI_03759, partial [Reticulomyxa filosa]
NNENNENNEKNNAIENQTPTKNRDWIETYIPKDWSKADLLAKLGACQPIAVKMTPEGQNSQFQLVELRFDSQLKKDTALDLLNYVQRNGGNSNRSSGTLLKRGTNQEHRRAHNLEALQFDRPDVDNTPLQRQNSLRLREVGDSTESDNDNDNNGNDEGYANNIDSVIFMTGNPKDDDLWDDDDDY